MSSGGHSHDLVDLRTGLADGAVIVGVGGVPTVVTPSGVVTMTNAGVFALASGTATLQTASVSISSADIVATAAGKLGHANGYPLVASAGAGSMLQLVGAILIYDYAGAGYGAGGNVTINWSGGGAAITGVVTAGNSLGATADKVVAFYPLAATATPLVDDAGFNLVAASAFTLGSATGVVRVKIQYLTHLTGL